VSAGPEPTPRSWVVAAGVAGVLGSVLVGAAEFSLHFTPTMNYTGPEYEFFLGTSKTRLTFGHFTAIFCAPLYYFGYWHLFKRLAPAPMWARRTIMFLGIYSFALGAVWLGSRVYPAILIQAREAAVNAEARAQIAALLETASFYNETILIGLRLGVLALSALFVWLVAAGRTSYPRWFAAANPILVVAACFALWAAVPSIGGYFMPIAMNVAHFVLFGGSLLLMRNATDASAPR